MWNSCVRLFLNQRRGLALFRNGCGPKVDFPGIKEGCRYYASGPERHNSGTISAKFFGYETRGVANCPRFTNLNAFN